MKNLFWLKGGDKTIAVECSIMLRQQNGRRFLGMLGNCFKMLVFLWFPSFEQKTEQFFFVKEKLKHTCQEQKAEMEKEVSFNTVNNSKNFFWNSSKYDNLITYMY